MNSILRPPQSPAWLVVPALLTAAVLGYWIVDFRSAMWLEYHIDTDVYRKGAQALLDGQPIYDLDYSVFGINLPFTYPPLAAIAFAPFTAVPLPVAGLLLSLISLGCLWWVAALALSHLGADRPRTLAFWVLPALGLLEPVRETISFGQINLVLMAMVATDALYRSKDRVSTGVLAGIAASLKLTPAVFIVYFLVRRQYRAAAVMVGSAVASTLLAAAVTPRLSWQYFTDTLINTSRIGDPDYLTNQSIFGVLCRTIAPDAASRVWPVAVVVLLALSFAAAWLVRSNALSTLAVVSLIALLASPISWSHHWVWIVVIAAAGSQISHWFGAAVLGIGILGPHWLMGSQPWSRWEQVLGNSYVIGGVLLLLLAVAAPALWGTTTGKPGPVR